MRSLQKLMIAVCLGLTLSASTFAHDDGIGKGGPGDTAPGYGSGMPYSSYRVKLRGQLSLASIGGTGLGSAIWGWTDTTDPGGPREYAMYGLANGTSFIDVTNPSNPVYKGFLPSATGSTAWRELRSYGDYAFIVSDSNGAHGMQVFDMKKLRDYAGTPITYSTAPSTFYQQYLGTVANPINNTHTIHINEATGYAYLFGTGSASGYSGGVYAIDISSPMAPTHVGGFIAPTNGGTSRYIHDGQAVTYTGPDTTYLGREILFAANARSSGNTNDDTVSIIDVTNKASMSLVGAATHADARYIHQGWLTPDQAYFLVNDELDEHYDQSVMRTHVYDVSDLDAPVYKGGWIHPVNSKNVDHNLFIKDTPWGLMAFESNYTMGLRIIRLDDLSGASPAMTEWGWFDTYPADDAIKSFNGQWGNYPFFSSGTIIAGDRQNGLFVLQMIPEPSTWVLLFVASGIFILAMLRKRRTKALAPVRV